jgi:hypothetical protein
LTTADLIDQGLGIGMLQLFLSRGRKNFYARWAHRLKKAIRGCGC